MTKKTSLAEFYRVCAKSRLWRVERDGYIRTKYSQGSGGHPCPVMVYLCPGGHTDHYMAEFSRSTGLSARDICSAADNYRQYVPRVKRIRRAMIKAFGLTERKATV